MNIYATLNDLRELLIVTEAEHNAQLLRVLIAASRQIEKPKLTGRSFYCYEGVKYYNQVASKLWLPDDILSISSLKCDTDGDGVFEVTMVVTDYFLHPLNSYPKTLLMVNPNGDYASFAPGIEKGVEITGVFGYADSATPYEKKTAINEGSGIDDSVIEFTIDDGSLVKIGQTIKVESEQMYVKDVVQNKLYVKRGVNGTTAASHANDIAVSVYTYPEDITQATLILAMRAWKRKDSAYQDIVGTPETGQIITSKGIDPDVLELCMPYRRQEYA